MIETVLFGKRAIVPTPEFLKMMKRKEALIDEALTIKKNASKMSAAEELDATAKVVGKIIRLNRKISSTGLSVRYLG